jgi:hypothetical protein
MAMLEIVSATVWAFLNVADFAALVVPTAWLPNVIEVALSVVGTTPVPLTVTDASTSFDVSLIVTEPETAPRTVGANATLIVQVLPAAILPAQVLLSVKYCDAAITTACADVPVFLSVTVFAALVLPVATFPNASVAGVTVTVADKLELALTRRMTVVRIQKLFTIDGDLRPTTAEARIETPEIVLECLCFAGGNLLWEEVGLLRGNFANY